MPLPVCYLDGEFLPLQEARISPLDRGFLFGDSVYEVVPVFDDRLFLFREHFDRLARSLREIRLTSPHSHEEWLTVLEELIRRNGGGTMYVYVQVTRGMEFGRDHAFPAAAKPTVFALASQLPTLTAHQRAQGLSAITVEDFRWGRCDIKTTALLANVLMKQQAVDAGAQEAIIVRDGEVLEGSSTSVFVVRNGALMAPVNSHRILPGTTREAALELSKDMTPIEIRRITIDELRTADEVWIGAATRDVLPITRIDGQPVGSGKPGPLWQKVSAAFAQLRERLATTRAP
jgi:D-alanine transaminase